MLIHSLTLEEPGPPLPHISGAWLFTQTHYFILETTITNNIKMNNLKDFLWKRRAMQKILHLDKENAPQGQSRMFSIITCSSFTSCNNQISNKTQPLFKAYSSLTEQSRPPTILPTCIPCLTHCALLLFNATKKHLLFTWLMGSLGTGTVLQSVKNFVNRKHLLNSIFSKSKS